MERNLQTAIPETSFTAARGLVLQRACACGKQSNGGGCEECSTKRDLQRSSADGVSSRGVSGKVNAALNTSGAPLDSSTRTFMESGFGHDFSGVRVHTGTLAAQSAESVNARAYTVGNHIVFANGSYNPSTPAGRRLIAHELTHTIQQGGQSSGMHQPQGYRISEPGDGLEREADAAAERVAAGRTLGGGDYSRASGTQNLLLQRDEGDDPKKKDQAKEPDKPWIPMPVFDEFDPGIIVPDIPGLPDFVKGQQVKLSQLKKALDFLRGKKKGGSDSKRICDLIPGMETAGLGKFAGQCCEKFKRDKDHCCTWRTLSILDNRCCHKDEVLLPSNKCFKPQIAPTIPTVPTTTQPTTPTFPRLELKIPRIRFGTIESTTIDKFKVDTANVPAGYNKELDHLAGLLKIYKDAEIHIEGHTDSTFTEEHNQKLSEKRAAAVKQELVTRGVSTAKMTVVGFGKSELRFPVESTPEEKAANRRVDVWFYTPPSKTMAEGLQLNIP
jgi:outer membrane protein OmpA-like peptidoglycan-associated protein